MCSADEMGKDIEVAGCCQREDWLDHLLLLGARQRPHPLSLPHLEHLQRTIVVAAGLSLYPFIPTGGSGGAGPDAAETLRTPCCLR